MPLETPFPQYKGLETINLTREGNVDKSNENQHLDDFTSVFQMEITNC